jgi:anti-sigma regulatory factor (Ser/Thr protein kinase)
MVDITQQAIIDNFDTLMEFVVDFSKKLGFSKKGLHIIRLVAEESIINVIRYAYPLNKEYINVKCDEVALPQRALKLQISDRGIPFNPLVNAIVDTKQPVEKRPIGGLGIHMIKKLADEISYSREEDTNTLTIIFYLTDKNIDSNINNSE